MRQDPWAAVARLDPIMPRAPFFALAVAASLGACTPTSPPAGPGEQPIVVPRLTVAGYSTRELLADFERARSNLLADEFADAAKGFDRLMRLAVDPELRSLAAFQSGVAHEALGDRERALSRYRLITTEHPREAVAKNALVRLTRLLGHAERWSELEQAAIELLRVADLPVMDRIEGHGAHALALVERGELDKAEIALSKAQELIERHRFGQAGVPPVQLAQVAFAEGEIRRIKSERITLTPVPPNFAEVLEARCQGLLDAQSAYTEAMRSRDAHWSAMSGYRVGQLYLQLHIEAMAIPAPKNASLDQKRLFEAAMRLRYRILVEKGLKMMDATVRLGERTGENSYWIARARATRQQLEQALEDEKRALAKLPYSEQELHDALVKLGMKPRSAEPESAKPAPPVKHDR
jgi:tetratricopeptide (TPR) repeat protein